MREMRILVCKDYDEMSQKAAQMISSQVMLKPDCVLCPQHAGGSRDGVGAQ